MADDTTALVPARWFDGTHSRGQSVLVGLRPAKDGPTLALHPLSAPQAVPLLIPGSRVSWPETWSRATPARLLVDLRDHGSLEITAVAQWQAAFAAAGGRPTLAHRMQTRWRSLLAVLLVATLALVLFYRFGTPWLAIQLTRAVPLSWDASLGENAMREMDAKVLKPSQLPAARQTALRERFDALLRAEGQGRNDRDAPQPRLLFRRGIGANAFALPGGTVVLTDELVEVAARHRLGDDALIGVLAHELGHVRYRHTTRMLVEQGVLNIGLGIALGDVSSLMSTGSALLTGLAYRRDHEREADCHALALMARADLPTAPMAELLMAASRSERPAPGQTQRSGGLGALLSSHPETPQRAEQLRRGQAPDCRR